MGIRLCEKCKYFIPKIGLGMGYCTKYNDEVMNFDYCEYWEVEMNRDRLDEMRETEAKEKQEQERLLKENPLMFYSTTQLKAELRRRKKESGR